MNKSEQWALHLSLSLTYTPKHTDTQRHTHAHANTHTHTRHTWHFPKEWRAAVADGWADGNLQWGDVEGGHVVLATPLVIIIDDVLTYVIIWVWLVEMALLLAVVHHKHQHQYLLGERENGWVGLGYYFSLYVCVVGGEGGKVWKNGFMSSYLCVIMTTSQWPIRKAPSPNQASHGIGLHMVR